jgi:hypothetical protein
VVSIFTALALTTDYAMFPLANIKLMDSIVFVSSLSFGLGVGVSIGALTWLVYGTINPLGSASGLLLVILILSETVYAFFGYLAGKRFNFDDGKVARNLLWGTLGLVGALIYDLNTIITPALLAGSSLLTVVAGLPFAIPFMLAHEISDFAFFSTAAPILYAAIRRVMKNRTPVFQTSPTPDRVQKDDRLRKI